MASDIGLRLSQLMLTASHTLVALCFSSKPSLHKLPPWQILVDAASPSTLRTKGYKDPELLTCAATGGSREQIQTRARYHRRPDAEYPHAGPSGSTARKVWGLWSRFHPPPQSVHMSLLHVTRDCVNPQGVGLGC